MTDKQAKFLLGGAAVVAAFLLTQSDVTVYPIVKVLLGAFLAFAAYADPKTLTGRDE